MKYLTDGFKNYINFSGRATRKQFWFYYIWIILIYVIVVFIDAFIGTSFLFSDYGLLEIIFVLGTLIPNLSITIRRLHDTDHEGAWVFIGVIPVLGSLYLLYLCCKDSGPDNEYGISLKYPNVATTAEN